MAADWIKVEKSTPRKPEVLRIAELLGIHPDHAFGLCVRFWFWCDDQMKTCHAQNVTIVTLDHTVGHTGFAQSLLDVGWLLVRNGSLEVPNFDRHLSASAKNRADSLRRKQKQREKTVTENCDKNVTHKRESESKRKSIKTKSIKENKFEEWYALYPRKEARGAAAKAYASAIARICQTNLCEQSDAEDLLNRWTTERVPAIKARERQFQKQPATWLNQECYLDEIGVNENESRLATIADLESWGGSQ